MSDGARPPLGELENELTDALRQFWWLHDARWYQGVKKRFGQEVANEINAEAIAFVSRRVGSWYQQREGTPDAGSPKELAAAVDGLTRVMTNERMMRSHTEVLSAGEGDGGPVVETVITEHFALRMLRAARSLEGYACPCLRMRDGWFQGLGVEVTDATTECMRTGGSVCRFHTESTESTESADSAPDAESAESTESTRS
ncbi:hypothetical protein AB0A60_07730 [Streptomyces sp. NPDC046275]|uniref:hypothetical protein n=1 Tax=Streptomyces sp. NPDC046275 TaxID=3157201 RepID=UPI0033D5844B